MSPDPMDGKRIGDLGVLGVDRSDALIPRGSYPIETEWFASAHDP